MICILLLHSRLCSANTPKKRRLKDKEKTVLFIPMKSEKSDEAKKMVSRNVFFRPKIQLQGRVPLVTDPLCANVTPLLDPLVNTLLYITRTYEPCLWLNIYFFAFVSFPWHEYFVFYI